MPIASPHDVLTFWFAPGQSDRWYAKDEAFDAEIRQRFCPPMRLPVRDTLMRGTKAQTRCWH